MWTIWETFRPKLRWALQQPWHTTTHRLVETHAGAIKRRKRKDDRGERERERDSNGVRGKDERERERESV